MKLFWRKQFLLVAMVSPITLTPISMVYNFRIAQITKQPIFLELKDIKHSTIALLFDQPQKTREGIFTNFAGGLGAFVYDIKPWYVRVDAAVSSIYQNNPKKPIFKGTETDDLLFTVGRNFELANQSKITVSGLFGVPTHQNHRLLHANFGYAQMGTGVQIDGARSVTKQGTLLYGARYIYFFPRNTYDSVGKEYTYTLGNIGDILLAYANSWDHHGLEGGYTLRSNFGANICPIFDDIIQKSNYLRSNFYLVYKYKFLHDRAAHRLLFDISYGFDHRPKRFGNKYIVTLWGSWNMRF